MDNFELEMIEALGGRASALRTIPDRGPVLMLGILAYTVLFLLIVCHFQVPRLARFLAGAARFITRYVVLAFKWVRGDDI